MELEDRLAYIEDALSSIRDSQDLLASLIVEADAISRRRTINAALLLGVALATTGLAAHLMTRAAAGGIDVPLSAPATPATSAPVEAIKPTMVQLRSWADIAPPVKITRRVESRGEGTRFDLAGPGRARGQLRWSRSRGADFTASGLSPIPRDKIGQLWLNTAAGPIAVAVVRPDVAGRVSAVVATARPEVDLVTGVLLTLEPVGGSRVPSRSVLLAGR